MSGFKLTGDLEANLAGLDERIIRGIQAAAHYTAPLAESHMRENAPWTDRTGNARNGLRAHVVTGGTKTAIVLHHSVPYGVFLEVRWGGKYAVIEPTIHAMVPTFIKAISVMAFRKV